jgi:hypothetical protein
VDKVSLEHPAAIPAAHALADAPNIRPQFVFLRGNPKRKGPEVPRRFLTVLSAGPRRRLATPSLPVVPCDVRLERLRMCARHA